MRHRFLLPILLILMLELSSFGGTLLFAQDLAPWDTVQGNSALRDSGERNRYNLSQFAHESWSFIKQPTRWDGGDWLRIGVTGAGTLLLVQADQSIRDVVTRDQRYYHSVPIEAGRMWGELVMPAMVFTGFAGYSLIADDYRAKKIAYEIVQTFLYAGVADKILNVSTGRSRPYDNEGSKSFHPFSANSLKPDFQSMPGGHCVVAFSISTILSRNAGPEWLKVLAYAPAALTFVARVYQDRHWTSDDFCGAALGYFVGTWVVDLHEQKESRIQISSVFPLTISIGLN